MKVKANFIYLIIIAFLIALLIIGHQINKKSSASKKNEISNIVNQLKTRNNQLVKIQKNLFEDGKNLNDIINKKEITFENIFKDKKLDGLNNFSYMDEEIYAIICSNIRVADQRIGDVKAQAAALDVYVCSSCTRQELYCSH